jgi:hypothetical protein
MQEHHFTQINDYKIRPQEFESTWRDLPPLEKNRTDIYFFGQPGSGKSCVLASLFHHADKEGLLSKNNINSHANEYIEKLSNGIRDGIIAHSRTSFEGGNFPVDLIHPNTGKEHPINLIVMSDQLLRDDHKNYLDTKNKKLIFFVLDYARHIDMGWRSVTGTAKRANKFQNILSKLDEYGTLNKTDGIYIIISKSDLFPDGKSKIEFAKEFVIENYKNFYANCKLYQKRNNESFEINIIPYTIGEMKYENLLVKFNSQPASDLINLICTYSITHPKPNFFRRLFD